MSSQAQLAANQANGIGDSKLESCPLGLWASPKSIENKGAAKYQRIDRPRKMGCPSATAKIEELASFKTAHLGSGCAKTQNRVEQIPASRSDLFTFKCKLYLVKSSPNCFLVILLS
jgi:hypothetical protein